MAIDLTVLGARLRALRAAAGESQAVTAEAIGVARSYLSDIEAGRRNITVQVLGDLADHFRVEPAELLRVEELPPDCQ